MNTYTEHAVEVYTENAGVNIYIVMRQAENFILREKQAENFMTEVVSQPTTMTSKVVIIDNVVQYVAVESARAEVEDRFSAPLSLTRVSVTEVEDRFSAPLSLTRVSVTRDSSEYSTREEVLAEQLTEQLEVFPPTRELRGGRAEERGEAHREGAEGQRLQEAVLGGQEDEVSEDAGTHIFRSKSPRCIGWRQVPPILSFVI